MADEDEIKNEETENLDGGMENDEGEDNENQKKSIPAKKKLILIIIPIVILLLGIAGVFLSGMLNSSEPTEAVTEEGAEPSAEGSAEKTEEGAEPALNPDGTPVVTAPREVYFDVPDILVNLNSGDKKQVYLKVLVTLALADATSSAAVEKEMPRIMDSFQVYLRELTVEEIQGSAGMFRLKEELVERINRIIAPARINDVLFKEMLIQ